MPIINNLSGNEIEILKLADFLTGVEHDITDVYFGELQVFTVWAETEGALPLTVNANGEALIDYKIYGNTVQDGTPTPDTPMMPEGCGERTWNLLPFDDKNFVISTGGSNLIVECKNGSLNMKGTATEIITTNANWKNNFTFELKAGTYYCNSPSPLGGAFGRYIKKYDDNSNIIGADKYTFTLTENTKCYLSFYIYNKVIDSEIKLMLNLGSTALPYEPYGYKLPILSNDTATDIYIGDTQLAKDEYVDSSTGKIYKWADITGLSEPLCGIGEYTDSLDLSTGTLTRRIGKLVLDGTGGKSTSTGRYMFYITNQLKGIAPICTHYVGSTVTYYAGLLNDHVSVSIQSFMTIYDDRLMTIDKYNEFYAAQYTAGTPVTIWYVLAEPEISTVPVPSGLTGTIEGYLIQDGTPTPESPIYPTANGAKQADGTYTIESAYITPTDPPVALPALPTLDGTTVYDTDLVTKPSKMYVKYRKHGT